MADDKQQQEPAPLEAEALKRDDWRGGATKLSQGDAPGHTLPESERDRAVEDGAQEGSGAISGTILPPD